jgi:hypothetical protein
MEVRVSPACTTSPRVSLSNEGVSSCCKGCEDGEAGQGLGGVIRGIVGAVYRLRGQSNVDCVEVIVKTDLSCKVLLRYYGYGEVFPP